MSLWQRFSPFSHSMLLGFPAGIPLLFLAVGVEYRGKARRGWRKGHKARSWTLGNEGSSWSTYLLLWVLKPSLWAVFIFQGWGLTLLYDRCGNVFSVLSGYPRVKAPIPPSLKHILETAPDPDCSLILFLYCLSCLLLFSVSKGQERWQLETFEENLIF